MLMPRVEFDMQAGSPPFATLVAGLILRAAGIALVGSALLTAIIATLSR